jgi:hypothetical protein
MITLCQQAGDLKFKRPSADSGLSRKDGVWGSLCDSMWGGSVYAGYGGNVLYHV